MSLGGRARRLVALVIGCSAVLALPLLALATPKALDKHFGKHGLATAATADGSGANLVAVRPDGEIIAAGMSIIAEGEDSEGGFEVFGFTPNGKLDSSFGDKGAIGFGFNKDEFSFDFPTTLGLTDDGKILVGGETADDSGDDAAGIARLNADGELDKTLAGDGTLAANPGGLNGAVAVLPLAGGAFYVVGRAVQTLEIARFEADGTLDPTFGDGGFTQTDLGGVATVGHAVLTADGKIVVVVHTPDKPSMYLPAVPKNEFALLRFNSDGTLDTTFGDDGVAVAEGAAVYNVAQDAKGKLLAAGGNTVARFTEDGQLDSQFGDGGVFTFSNAGGFAGDGLAAGPRGTVVVSGSMKARKSKTTAQRFAVAVLTGAGRLDRKFANRGFVSDKHGDVAKAVTTQDDGKIIAAGRTFGRNIFIGDIAGRETKVMVARYLKP